MISVHIPSNIQARYRSKALLGSVRADHFVFSHTPLALEIAFAFDLGTAWNGNYNLTERGLRWCFL